jgi:hypothetical protein
MRFDISLFLLLLPSVAFADGLTDLRAALGRLTAATPAHGTIEVTSTNFSTSDLTALLSRNTRLAAQRSAVVSTAAIEASRLGGWIRQQP